ncbi:MAG: hypothetical protein FWC13_01845 [Oscillospiraceae bacterium]|nr:hypothetical protein [Oscillospiraceae bacterium]
MKKKFYTLKDALEFYNKKPSGEEGEWITYSRQHVIEVIKNDYHGNKMLLNERCICNCSGKAEIFGITLFNENASSPDEEYFFDKPYPDECKHLLKSNDRYSTWVMNREYMLNLFFELERRKFPSGKHQIIKASRKQLKDKLVGLIEQPIKQNIKDLIYQKLEHEMVSLDEQIRLKIEHLNECNNAERNRFDNILLFFKKPQVFQNINAPMIIESLESKRNELKEATLIIDCTSTLQSLKRSVNENYCFISNDQSVHESEITKIVEMYLKRQKVILDDWGKLHEQWNRNIKKAYSLRYELIEEIRAEIDSISDEDIKKWVRSSAEIAGIG